MLKAFQIFTIYSGRNCHLTEEFPSCCIDGRDNWILCCCIYKSCRESFKIAVYPPVIDAFLTEISKRISNLITKI